ncbi:uncharacterized protein AAES06_013582 isoform 2-T2 [Glossophaga mutica]
MGGDSEFREDKKVKRIEHHFSCQSWGPKQPKESTRTPGIQWNSAKVSKAKAAFRGASGPSAASSLGCRQDKPASKRSCLAFGIRNIPEKKETLLYESFITSSQKGKTDTTIPKDLAPQILTLEAPRCGSQE